jgi:hypothetical protein
MIARFLYEEERRVSRESYIYFDEFVGLLTNFYKLPAHKRNFARELLDKAQQWFEINS